MELGTVISIVISRVYRSYHVLAVAIFIQSFQCNVLIKFRHLQIYG